MAARPSAAGPGAQALARPAAGGGGRRAVVLLAYGRNRWAEADFLQRAGCAFCIEELPGTELDELYQCEDVTVLRLTLL